MPTTQSEDPNERVHHPRHYNQHPSGIETIEIIEHLPSNLANAVKYIWRCGLKQTETPLRDLKSALWYTKREIERRAHHCVTDNGHPSTQIIWRMRAQTVIESQPTGLLSAYLEMLLHGERDDLVMLLEEAIKNISCDPL